MNAAAVQLVIDQVGDGALAASAQPGEPDDAALVLVERLALGPPAFMHRFSGEDNPEAPISHHWLDSTHITYGVVTLGYVLGNYAKAEMDKLSTVQSVYVLDTNGIPAVYRLDTQEGRKEVREKERVSNKNEDELSRMQIASHFQKGYEILRGHNKNKE